jgi:hypothetical protein
MATSCGNPSIARFHGIPSSTRKTAANGLPVCPNRPSSPITKTASAQA